MPPLQGGVSMNTMAQGSTGNGIANLLGSALKTSLFMEALRNLNWSRDYLWYCELDGVPSPFHRGGVLGLPCTNIQYTLSTGSTYRINSFMQDLVVPHRTGEFPAIQLTLLDDEQGTLRQFFERWYNQIYNPYLGVLPITEACKQLTIYTQKTTRTNIKRIYYDIDKKLTQLQSSIIKTVFNGIFKGDWGLQSKNTEGIDYLVFPSQDFTIRLNSGGSGNLISFTVNLEVAQFVNQDFGNPTAHSGTLGIGSLTSNVVSNGTSFLDKIADYI